MRRWMAVIVLLLVAGAYLAGWWPERTRRKAVEAQKDRLASHAAALEQELRLAQIENRLLSLAAAVEARNFGIATTEAARIFDALEREAGSLLPAQRTAIERIRKQRENLVTALQQQEPADPTRLRVMLAEMREAMTELRSGAR